jgi:Protein of unknown function (DUF1826)
MGRHKDPTFRPSNPSPVNVNEWNRVFAPPMLPLFYGIGIDSEFRWKLEDDCTISAKQWLDQMKIGSNSQAMFDDLRGSMNAFHEFCELHLIRTHKTSFKARITSFRGLGSVRCPLWHFDNVALRWIQAVVGQGVVYVSEDSVRWMEFQGIRTSSEPNETIDQVNSRRIEDHVPRQGR